MPACLHCNYICTSQPLSSALRRHTCARHQICSDASVLTPDNYATTATSAIVRGTFPPPPHCHKHSHGLNAYGDDEAHKPVWLLTLECMKCPL
jgi:hypothetical protein